MLAKKKFGQNFLIDSETIQNIVSLVNVKEDDLILEIGPGRGALTKFLSKKGCQCIAIEVDKDMKPCLDVYSNDGVNIIYEDFLNIDLLTLLSKYKYNHLYIVGNLPYYITTPIITHIIESNVNVYKMIFMVQEEVAQRLSSEPNHSEYGFMTAYINMFFNCKYEFIVTKEKFMPSPKVNSAIISLNSDIKNFSLDFVPFLKEAFSLKRKNLKNNLKSYGGNKLLDVLNELEIPLTIRAEQLDVETLYKIFIKLKE